MSKKTKAQDGRTLRILTYLDGEFSEGQREAFVSELSSNEVLARETRAWESLFDTLRELPDFSPSEDFRPAVLAALRIYPSAATSLGRWLVGNAAPPPKGVLAQLAEGSLSKRDAKILAAFVRENPDARVSLSRWEQLHAQLDALPALNPSPDFAGRVMARVRLEPAKVGLSRRLAGRLARIWPERRQKLAVASGVAFGPTAVLGTLAYMVFSNPLTTPSALVSYLWSKSSGQISGSLSTLFSTLLDSGAVRSLYSALGGMSLSGANVGALLGLFGVTTLAAAWVLYRNLFRLPSTDQQHVAT